MNKDEKTKRCPKCKDDFPATEHYFGRNKRSPDGLQPWCKECKNEWNREYIRKQKEKGTQKPIRNDVKQDAITEKHIKELRDKYKLGDCILFKKGKRWERASIIRIHNDFTVIQMKNYATTVYWLDILIGDTKVKEVS